MVFNYNGVDVYYKIYGCGEKPTLLLHGWGCSGEVFENLVSLFPERTFIAVDFPPFGKSQKEFAGWNIFTYVSMVMSLCEHLRLEKFDVLGHSFGGRIAVLLSALKKSMIKRCVLVDAAGLKPRRGLKYHLKVWKFKLCRKMGRNVERFGSEDYQKLSEDMKKTFVSIVNQPLEDYAAMIQAPTLIVYGKNDKETPVYMAKKFHRLIKNSKCVLLEDAGHFSFLDSPLAFYRVLKEFWEEI